MKKALSIAFLVLLLTSVLVLVNSVNIGNVAGQVVSGVINQDTTWTLANSPYQITGNVLVSKDVTLTIEPGVTVNFEQPQYYILVNGTIRAIGTSGAPIIFNSGSIEFNRYSAPWNTTTNTGCIVSNANITVQINFFSLDEASPMIANNTIFATGSGGGLGFPIEISRGSPLICNNTIHPPATGAGLELTQSSSEVSNNVIYGTTSNDPLLSMLYPGDGIRAYGDRSIIQRNIIINCTNGILFSTMSPSPLITVKNNLIINNSVGILIRFNPNPLLLNNSIQNNTKNSIACEQYYSGAEAGNVNATYNWWGTVDQQKISQSIYDSKNDFNLGTVSFNPFLTQPDVNTPTCAVAVAEAGGSISYSGINRMNVGDSKTFSISANSGYHVADVKVNGTSIGAVASYNLQSISGLTTISASFALDPTPTPTPTPNPTNNPTNSPTTNPTTTNPTSEATPKPTQSPTATPTPTVPEFSAIAALFLVAAATALMVFLKIRRQNQHTNFKTLPNP